MTVKELKDKLNQYDDNKQICVYGRYEHFYEPIDNLHIAQARKHENVYSDALGNEFIDSYKKEFLKYKKKNIVAIYYE